MYTAPHSREERKDVLLRAIADIQFGVLVISHDGLLDASHLPMIVREDFGREAVIEGHVSRANPLWKVAGEASALAIFQGPQAYIHPGWYPTKQRDGRAVPTWAYIAVHVHGTLAAIEDQDWLTRHLEGLTARNEVHRAAPWSISDAPADYVRSLMKGIVGLRLKITNIEGNWKMAQKQPLENRLGAAMGLAASTKQEDQDVATLMSALADSNIR